MGARPGKTTASFSPSLGKQFGCDGPADIGKLELWTYQPCRSAASISSEIGAAVERALCFDHRDVARVNASCSGRTSRPAKAGRADRTSEEDLSCQISTEVRGSEGPQLRYLYGGPNEQGN